MFTESQPTREPLENGLILTSPGTHADIARLAAFNVMIHGEDVLDGLTRTMIQHYPYSHPEQWLTIEDPQTGQIVSSLCLIPWRWRYEDVTLKVGEMGIVGTHPDYRGRGLIRTLVRRFNVLLDEGAYDLSQIEGIPYYYRQYGYEYALPLEGGWQLEPRQVPDELPAAAQGFTFRRATTGDIPQLKRDYAQSVSNLAIHAQRDTDIWRYQLDHTDDVSDGPEIWIVVDPHGTDVGYVRIGTRGFGAGLIVNEASALSDRAAMAVLAFAKRIAQERGKPYIRLALADSNPLVTIARTWDARSEGRYAWQIRFPDPARLLRAIAPVLERRVAASPFAGLTHTFTLNLFRSAVALAFEDGCIAAISTHAAAQGNAENHMPPTLLVPLVLGWRDRVELEAIYPDFAVWGNSRALFDVLFPKMTAFIYPQY